MSEKDPKGKYYRIEEDIAKALAGDVGARMRVEVLEPWTQLLVDEFRKADKTKLNPGYNELMTGAIKTLATMVIILAAENGFVCSPAACSVIASLVEMEARRLSERVVVHALAEAAKKEKP